MDSKSSFTLCLLILSSVFCFQSRAADSTGSVYFLDSSTHQYLRSLPSDTQNNLISLPEVGAAVSVLLGFAPPATLSAASSDKLNELLMPNPFVRPRAVLMIEVNGAEAGHPTAGDKLFGGALKSRFIFHQTEAHIELPDEDEVSVVSLNQALSSDIEFSDQDLSDFASFLGGSYDSNAEESLSGVLIIPLKNAGQIKLHMSKKADRKFILSLVSLIRNIQRAVEMHQDFSGSSHAPAELVKGRFDGIKALQEHYGTDGFVHQGVELVVTSLSKIFNSMQAAYKGQIVGIILFNGTLPPESETMLNVMFTSRPIRWLEESQDSLNTTIAEVILVRRTLAWITGIILLISTLLGIYYLLNMPIARDTLLYSNVKLD